ncbi:HupE/UreJ family protein [Marnyiella aurantia]|uniref:HupE/UreJ family protein n=1 Tax=Marnyiella aurantia TaxID=2758037 RepID=A0A7D7QFE4_9FLAO|nr:HupE/UreJ family protein [Marnyiella aurantia]MBA5247693.1 HupE/UreJ family protein [Marnyiella aurantia]QMS99441.1 HupE/UreJ family protein [Marnyiella aurantia]
MQDFLFYLNLGWEHIISLDALDHQLFVLVLVVVFSMKDWKKILWLITAFTIGHSVTLALSVLEIVRVPGSWVEFLIPLTIFITAADNILMKNRQQNLMKMNHYLAMFFGLIHGMGFANTARMTMAQEQDLLLPLLGFNIGLELGQILVVAFILVLQWTVLGVFKANRKDWVLFISAGVFALALQMTLERLPF